MLYAFIHCEDDILSISKIMIICAISHIFWLMQNIAIFFDGAQIIDFMISKTNFAVDKYNLFVHCTLPFTNLNVSYFYVITADAYKD